MADALLLTRRFVAPSPAAASSSAPSSPTSRWAASASLTRRARLAATQPRSRWLAGLKVHAEVKESGDQPKWWEKNAGPNMIDIHSTQEFLDALRDARDRLVVVEFYGTWCGSCRALFPRISVDYGGLQMTLHPLELNGKGKTKLLHTLAANGYGFLPKNHNVTSFLWSLTRRGTKLCRTALENPDVLFLKVNFDENKPMCKQLNVKVLPFFHFYRGADGQLEAMSCSLAKFQKLKDAIAVHNTARCSIGPPAGVGDVNLLESASPQEKPAEASSR